MDDSTNEVEKLKQLRKHLTAEKVEAIKNASKLYRYIGFEGR